MLHGTVYTSWIRLQESLEEAKNELLDKFFSTCNSVQNTIAYIMHNIIMRSAI